MYNSIADHKTVEKTYKSFCKFFKPIVSSLVWAEQINGNIYHNNLKKNVLAMFNERCYRKVRKLPNYEIFNHLAGHTDIFFCGNEDNDSRQTLVMLDVDCNKKSNPKGSAEGAMNYCQDVLESLFPGVYHESSRSGKGRNGYIIVDKGRYRYAPAEVNKLLNKLERYLRSTIKEFDIADVEVKGTLSVPTWLGSHLEDLTYGMPARLPKDISRLDEMMRIPVVTVEWLESLPEPEVAAKRTKTRGKAGSSTNVNISEDTVARMDWYQYVAERLMPEPIRTSDRHVATQEDMAIFLMLLETFTLNMNADGSLPMRRFEVVWRTLHQDGRVARAYDPSRCAVLRNHLSSLGLLIWIDETYSPGTIRENGKGDGRAAKWQASEALMEALSQPIEERESIFTGTSENTGETAHHEALQIPQIFDPDYLVPVLKFMIFDYLAAAERIDAVVRSWTPSEAAECLAA